MTSFFKINTPGTLWGINFKGNKDGSTDLRQIDISPVYSESAKNFSSESAICFLHIF